MADIQIYPQSIAPNLANIYGAVYNTPQGNTNIANIYGKLQGTINTAIQTLPTLTKGSQGSTGISIQELKDAGRTAIIFSAAGAATGSTGTEAAITLTKSAGTGATSTGTSFVVTSGKIFRISQIIFGTRGNATATAQVTNFNIRMNTSGAVTTSSTPILMTATCATPATSSAYDRIIMPIPDGYEITGNGTIQIGVTANSVYTTNAPTLDVIIVGYEY